MSNNNDNKIVARKSKCCRPLKRHHVANVRVRPTSAVVSCVACQEKNLHYIEKKTTIMISTCLDLLESVALRAYNGKRHLRFGQLTKKKHESRNIKNCNCFPSRIFFFLHSPFFTCESWANDRAARRALSRFA